MSCSSCCCCCCCTSTRGASFFCTSIHVFIGMYLSMKWIVVTFMNGVHVEYFEDHRMQVIYPLLLLYLAIFLVLGCVNFTAVEREAAGVLKWSMTAFTLLQISMLLTNTLLGFAFPEHDNDLGVHRFYHVKFMVINVVATSAYYYVVWRFIFSLENGIYVVHSKKRLPSDSSGHLTSRSTAPWSQGQEDNESHGRENESRIPLKSSPPPLHNDEPQPCSSKSRNY